MPKNDIGGFFVSLGLNIDKHSFETGNKLIDNVGNSFNKLIGSARNAAVVLAGTAIATGAVENSAYKTAAALGMTTEALDLWKATAKIANVDANALVSSIGKIAAVQNRIRFDGSGLSQLQTQLNKLQTSYAEIQDMSSDEATAYILNKAQSMLNGDNLAEIAAYVEDVLGAGGRDLLIELDRRKTTLPALQADAQKTILTTAADNEKGANFITEVNTLKAEAESIGKLLGDTIGGEITPYLKGWNKWIQENRDNITETVKGIAEVTGKIVGYLNESTKRLLMDENQTQDAEQLNSALEGHRSFNFKENGIWGGMKEGLFGDADYKLLSEFDKNRVATYYKKYNTLTGLNLKNADLEDIKARSLKSSQNNQNSNIPKADTSRPWWESNNKINDGIIRPDGSVTQIAPDDWVLAARDIGDMARAFIPHNYNSVSAPAEYVINQTFNISGTNDMPQVLKQQAYKGTQEGLQELMLESSRRLQLMSGLR